MKYLALTMTVALLSACSSLEQLKSPSEALWVYHEAWQSAPKEIVEESGPVWTANGALIRFCTNGRFRMATGVLYRGGGQITLGVSDGLTLYEGTWHSTEQNGIEVSYTLVDAEIWFSGYEEARNHLIIDNPTISGNKLRFIRHRLIDDQRFPLTFRSADTLRDQTADKWVECSDVA